jgi:hypothetical protein
MEVTMENRSLIPDNSRLLKIADWIALGFCVWIFAVFCAMSELGTASPFSVKFLWGTIQMVSAVMVLTLFVKSALYFVASLLHVLVQPSFEDGWVWTTIQGAVSIIATRRTLRIVP